MSDLPAPINGQELRLDLLLAELRGMRAEMEEMRGSLDLIRRDANDRDFPLTKKRPAVPAKKAARA